MLFKRTRHANQIQDEMKFKIPFKTPTVNNMYVTWTPKGRSRPMRIKSKESKVQSEKIKDIILSNHTETIEGELRVTIDIYSNWYNKDGTIKKRDIANLEKFITDSIFNNLQDMNDKQIFEVTMNKIQSDKEFTIVEITKLDSASSP